MVNNNPITSETLQKKHPNVYRDFFLKNDIVISSHHMLAMITGMAWRVGGPVLVQKINQQCYVGVTKAKEGSDMGIVENVAYVSQLDKFEETKYVSIPWEKGLVILKDILTEKLGHEPPPLSFSVINEVPESRSLDSGVPVLILVASYLHFDLMSWEDLKGLASLTSKEKHAKESRLAKLFDELHRYSSHIRLLSQPGSTSGYVDYTTLTATKTPVVYLPEERAGSVEKSVLDLPPLDGSMGIDHEHFNYWGFRLDELANVQEDFPLDAVWIYPGSSRRSGAATRYTTTIVVPSFDDLRDYTKKLFSEIEIDEKHAPAFLKNMDVDGLYWQYAGRGQMISRLQLVRDLIHMCEDRYNSNKAQRFLDSLNVLFYTNGPFEESPSKKLETMIGMLRQKAHEAGIPIGIRVYRYGKQDGNILVYSPPQKFQKEIFEVIDEMKKVFGDDINADFVSWRDGWGTNGIVCEQFLAKDIHSPLFPSGTKKILFWDQQDGLTEQSESTLEQRQPDLLLDATKGKIYVGGKSVTSKDIPSQKGSIEIFSQLLENIGKPQSNTDLPAQTYASYRNELQGKIVGPLEKLVEKRTKGTLGVSLQGQLTDFKVTFSPKRLSIAIIKER
jgi:hypothetical protein